MVFIFNIFALKQTWWTESDTETLDDFEMPSNFNVLMKTMFLHFNSFKYEWKALEYLKTHKFSSETKKETKQNHTETKRNQKVTKNQTKLCAHRTYA